MKPYLSYKDSGDFYINYIPSHWDIDKLKRNCYLKGRVGWQGLKHSEFQDDKSLPYLITGMNFKNGVIKWDEVYHISEERYEEAPEIQLKSGDVLMTKDGTIGKLLFVDTLPGKASLNSHLLVLRPLNDAFVPRFLYYQLLSEHFNNHVELYKSGTTFYGLSQEAMGSFKMILPPKEEQIKISEYLDFKTGQIDRFIANKYKLIQLLSEEQKVILNQVITKGLNPNALVKQSGEPAIGTMPSHWGISRLKYFVSTISKGTTPSTINREIVENGEIKFIKAENISSNTLQVLPSYSIDAETNTILKRSKLEEGDVLIVIAGATIGKVAIVTNHFLPANTNQAVCFIRLKDKRLTRFLWLWLQTYYVSEFIKRESTQSAQPNLSMEDIGNFFFPNIGLNEVEQIVDYIAVGSDAIKNTITEIENEICLLKEYKIALISEVVTGKVDVQNELIAETLATV